MAGTKDNQWSDGVREGWYALALALRMNLTAAQALRAIHSRVPSLQFFTREQMEEIVAAQEAERLERMRQRRRRPEALRYQREYQRMYRRRQAENRAAEQDRKGEELPQM